MADPITLAALRAFINLTDPQMSPDGSRIAYVRTTRDYAHDRNVGTIVVVDPRGGRRTVIDPGPFASAPHWSPDGSRLAYLRHTEKKDEDQIVVAAFGGVAPKVVTHAKNGVQHFAWSPDGTRFAYDTPDDDPGAAAAKRKDDLFEVGDDGFLIDAPVVPSHLWLTSASGGTARRLTYGTWSVFETSPAFSQSSSDPSWTHDGKTIVFNRAEDAHTALTDRTAPAAVDIATGTVRFLGTTRQYAYEPLAAPRGNTYAYVRPHGPGPVTISDVVVGTLDSNEERDVTNDLDRDVSAPQWLGDSVLTVVADGAYDKMVVVPPTGAPRKLDVGALSVESAAGNAKGEIAFVATAYGKPPELYVTSAAGGSARAITHENAAMLRYDYGRAEHITWTGPDGEASDGVLVHPAGERPGAKYPLLLWSHGGPEGEFSGLGFGEEYAGGYDAGIMASANGWYSFFPNYRGSNNLGNAHEHGVYRDPGEGPSRDVLAGLAQVERTSPIDTSRECIGGHSYGGFMTAWIIGHDARWKCAIVADGAVDWHQAYELSGTGNLSWTRDSLGGTPVDPTAAPLYTTGSPITYAAAVKTPTLIITGLRDEVVPFTESWTYFHALRDRNVTAKLIAIPTAHHTPSDPVRLESYYRHMETWLREYLR